jgi:signal transduction histidine kinase
MGPSNAEAGDGRGALPAKPESRVTTEYRRHAARRRGHVTPAVAAAGAGTVPATSTVTPRRVIADDAQHASESRTTWVHLLAVAAAVVVGFAFLNPVAVHAPDLRATTETMIATLALASACLLQAQFMRTRRARDLLLFGSLLTFAFVELVAYFLPAALNLPVGTYVSAVGLWGKIFAAAGLVLAGLTPGDRLVSGGRRPIAAAVGVSLVAVAIAELLGLALGGLLVFGVNHPVPGIEEALNRPVGVVLVLICGGLLTFAAFALARSHEREHGRDRGLALLAGAAVLLAASRLYFLPLPWLSSDFVSPREGLRLLAWALVLGAVVRQELAIRADIARAAAAAERRRVAQDLHDSLAQDLALIAAHGPLMANQFGGEHPVIIAARRALAVSRGTISYLSDPARATTREALDAVADELRARFEIAITVDGGLRTEPAPYVREDLSRIAREAIANSARHGGAQYVIVSLRQDAEGITMRVSDDGRGISAESGDDEGFGLGSMRERAAALGGQLSIKRSGKRGTELEVAIP